MITEECAGHTEDVERILQVIAEDIQKSAGYGKSVDVEEKR